MCVAELQRADVFALPVRTRLAGLNPEGLGLAALEAAACGLPVVVGDSGGAPETVRDGRDRLRRRRPMIIGRWPTGWSLLLTDRDAGPAMGAGGRAFVPGRILRGPVARRPCAARWR